MLDPTWLMPVAAARRIAPLCNTMRHRDTEMRVPLTRTAPLSASLLCLRYSRRIISVLSRAPSPE